MGQGHPEGGNRFCTTCGKALLPQSRFCVSCGAPVQEVQAVKVMPRAGQGQPMTPAKVKKATKKRWLPIAGVVILVLFLWLSGVSLWYWLISCALFGIAFYLTRTGKVKRALPRAGIWALTGALIFVIASLGAGVSGREVTVLVKPSDAVTQIQSGAVTVSIPGGTVTEAQKLSITEVTDLPRAISGLEALGPAIDVKLGDMTRFDRPLGIAFPYDPEKLKRSGIEPSEAFIAVYYHEPSGYWKDVPYTVDEAAGVVRLQTNHLSIFECYYAYVEGDGIFKADRVSVIYDQTAAMQVKFSQYEDLIGMRSTSTDPLLVTDIAQKALKVVTVLEDQELKMPEKLRIFITEEDTAYNSITGNISIGMDKIFMTDPSRSVTLNLTHELFHIAQEYALGDFDYQTTGAKNVSFWMEATAEYMAQTGIWELMNEAPFGQYQLMTPEFFEKSLYTVDGKHKNGGHEYEAGSFVDFMQRAQYKVKPASLILAGAFYSSFTDAFNSIYSNADGKFLEDFYRDFMEVVLFDNDSRLQHSSNAMLDQAFVKKTALQFELDQSGMGLLPAIEGNAQLAFKHEMSASFYKFTTNCDTDLTITPQSDVILYRLNLKRAKRGFEEKVDAFAGTPSRITFGKEEIILVTQVSDVGSAIPFAYSAEPASERVFTGKWVPSQWAYSDLQATESFWKALYEQTGQTKETFVQSQTTSGELPPVFLEVTGIDPLNPTGAALKGEDGSVGLNFEKVHLNGNGISMDAAENENSRTLKIRFDLVLQGDELKGQMRADISGMVTTSAGDQAAEAFTIFDVAFKRSQ